MPNGPWIELASRWRHRLAGRMPHCGRLRCDEGYTCGTRRRPLDRPPRQCHLRPVSRPDGRSGKGRKAVGEESPGSTETRCRLTAGGGDPRESATESKPPGKAFALRRVRVKGWGKSPPRDRQRDRHGKPHREQNRIGTAWGDEPRQVSRPAVRVGCTRRPATGALQRNGRHAGESPPYRTRLTGQLAHLRRRRPTRSAAPPCRAYSSGSSRSASRATSEYLDCRLLDALAQAPVEAVACGNVDFGAQPL